MDVLLMIVLRQMYCDPDCKPWTSASWAPEGFASRADIAAQDRALRDASEKTPAGVEEGRMEKTAEGPQ